MHRLFVVVTSARILLLDGTTHPRSKRTRHRLWIPCTKTCKFKFQRPIVTCGDSRHNNFQIITCQSVRGLDWLPNKINCPAIFDIEELQMFDPSIGGLEIQVAFPQVHHF